MCERGGRWTTTTEEETPISRVQERLDKVGKDVKDPDVTTEIVRSFDDDDLDDFESENDGGC